MPATENRSGFAMRAYPSLLLKGREGCRRSEVMRNEEESQ